jgi:hypothetical protein
MTVQQQDRRPRAAVAHPQHSVADVDPVQRELLEHACWGTAAGGR